MSAGTAHAKGPGQPGFARRNAWVLVLGVFLVVIAVVTAMKTSSQRGQLAAQEQRIEDRETQLSEIELSDSERIDADVREALGVSRQRMASDTRTITQMLDTAFTWDSGVAYEHARTSLKQRYGLSEEDSFLTDFMPPSRFSEDADGKRYYYIDTMGLNSDFGGTPDIEVVDVTADEYRYAVIAVAQMSSDSVKQNQSAPAAVRADRPMLMFVTIDGRGVVSDLSGTSASGSIRHSD